MENHFLEKMRQLSDAELLKIVNEQRKDFHNDAIEAAENELKYRNLSSEIIQEKMNQNIIDEQIKSDKAKEGLDTFIKILALLFPGIILILFAIRLKADGYIRKGKDLKRWTLYGFAFYILLLILIYIICAIVDIFT